LIILKSFYLSILFSGIGFLLTIIRDFSLNNHLDDIKFFVTYISICALITTPISERMQYGLKFNKNLLLYSTTIFLISLIVNIIFLKLDKYQEIKYIIGLIQNIIICLNIAMLMGTLASNHAPHMLRIMSPIFPIINMILVFIFFLEQSFFIVNLSYLILLLIVIIFYTIQSINFDVQKQEKKKSNLLLFKSIFWHYLVFSIAYISVLLNANYFNFDHLFIIRVPIYFYLVISILLPYYSFPNKLKFFFSIFAAIFLGVILVYIFLEPVFKINFLILIIEILLIYQVAKIAKLKSA